MQETISFAPISATSVIAQNLWLIPALPIVASGVIALLKQPKRKASRRVGHRLAGFSLLLSLVAFGHVFAGWTHGAVVRETVNFAWLQFGRTAVDLGWVLDPLAAVMLVMVSFVGLADLHLLRRLHGPRRKLHALLLLPLALCRSHARRGHLEQPAAALHVLGDWSASPLICSSASGIKSRRPLRPQRKHSSPRALATSSSCWELSGSFRRPARCSSTTTAQARWKPSRSPTCSRSTRRLASAQPAPSAC